MTDHICVLITGHAKLRYQSFNLAQLENKKGPEGPFVIFDVTLSESNDLAITHFTQISRGKVLVSARFNLMI